MESLKKWYLKHYFQFQFLFIVCDHFYFPHGSSYGIGGVMVSVLNMDVLDRKFEPRSSQIDDYTTGVSCFSAKEQH
jgi:hypothetical protein